jgi:predicted transcriptional regulator
MVRNNKYLKRIDDLQQIVEDLHKHIQKLQTRTSNSAPANANVKDALDSLNRRIDELHLRNDILQQRTSIINNNEVLENRADETYTLRGKVDLKNLFDRWKKFPGQGGKNNPNLLKQTKMLAILYENKSLNAANLFSKTGVNGVTGARYVSVLKKYDLIEYKGARKKGQYNLTSKGMEFIESNDLSEQENLSTERKEIFVSSSLEAKSDRLQFDVKNSDL